MTNTQIDWSVGIGKESTYGVPVAPTRFFESDASMKYDVQKTQSKLYRPTKRLQRLNRNVLKHIEVSGDQTLEPTSKGFGFILEALLGVNSVTVIPTTAPAVYQQVHTLRKTDPAYSYTIQEVLPTLGGGNTYPHTFAGNLLDSCEFSAKEGEILEAKLAWLGRDMDTTTGATAASYPASDELFTFVGASIGLAGTLTTPTTTAPGSLSSALSSNVKDFAVTVKNNLDSAGYNAGGAGRRSRANALGAAEVSGKLTVEYTDNTLRDAYVAQTPLPLVLNFAGTTVLSATPTNTFALLQIVVPAILLKGEVPTSNGSEPITQSIDWEAFDNGAAAEPVYFVYRSLDTAV